MSTSWLRNSLLGLALVAIPVFPARALGNLGLVSTSYYAPVAETVYSAVPTSYVVPTTYMATSYVAPTSYVYPTAAYLYPTSFAYPTAYVTPTAYTATSYVAPTFFRRGRYVTSTVYATGYYTPTAYYTPAVYATSYYTPTAYATSYYTPTVLDTSVVASSSACCNEAAPVAAAPSASQPMTRSQQERAPSVDNDERAPRSSAVESVPENEPTGTNPPAQAPSTPPAPAPPAPAAPDSGTPPTPSAPAPEAGAPPPAPTSMNRPAPPAEGVKAGPVVLPGIGDQSSPSFRYQARKPVTPASGRFRNRVSNVLEGKVLAGDTRQGEEGVRVIVSNGAGGYDDRVATTDAFGHYAMRLPDGDWTVKVAMPSGRVYSVQQITISGGQITNSNGQDVPTLIITR